MKNSKSGQKLAVTIISLVCLFFLLIYWYKQTDAVEANHTYEINSSNSDQKLLIVAQDSPFKDSITAVVSAHYKSENVAIEVVKIRGSVNIEATDFDAILIIHRWEARAAPDAIQSFMDKNVSLKNKMVVMTTSWNGLEKMENIDAITGASIVDNVPIFANKIIKKLDPLLKHKQ